MEIAEREIEYMEHSRVVYLDAADEDGRESYQDRLRNSEKTPEEAYASKERVECLQRSIDRLPEEIRKVITCGMSTTGTTPRSPVFCISSWGRSSVIIRKVCG